MAGTPFRYCDHLYSLLGLFMTLFYMGDAPSVGIALGIVMHVSILLSGIALLVCRAPKLPEHSRPVICIQERLFRFCFSVLLSGHWHFFFC